MQIVIKEKKSWAWTWEKCPMCTLTLPRRWSRVNYDLTLNTQQQIEMIMALINLVGIFNKLINLKFDSRIKFAA